MANLPIEPHVQPKPAEFLAEPDSFFDSLPKFNNYFAVFEPGVERAVNVPRDEIIRYVAETALKRPDYPTFYLSGHDYTFSGAINVESSGSIWASFVLGQYNELSSGRRLPDLVVTKPTLGELDFVFTGVMGGEGDWRSDTTLYPTEAGSEIDKPNMAKMAKQAIYMLPRDGSTFSPGWYELKVLEYAGDDGRLSMHPFFIKAVY